jgi:hypothetical protein
MLTLLKLKTPFYQIFFEYFYDSKCLTFHFVIFSYLCVNFKLCVSYSLGEFRFGESAGAATYETSYQTYHYETNTDSHTGDNQKIIRECLEQLFCTSYGIWGLKKDDN